MPPPCTFGIARPSNPPGKSPRPCAATTPDLTPWHTALPMSAPYRLQRSSRRRFDIVFELPKTKATDLPSNLFPGIPFGLVYDPGDRPFYPFPIESLEK